jgi:hypothetical protein
VSHPVEVTGIEQRDAGVKRRVDSGNTLRIIRRPINPGHAHAAKTNGRHSGSWTSELARRHARHQVQRAA